VLDLLPRDNDSMLNAQALWAKRGTTADRTASADDDPQNDGLVQRHSSSCGPTTLQMMIAEADPIFALSLHHCGVSNLDSDDAVALFQRRLVEKHGGIAIGRLEAFERARLRNVLGRLQRSGEIEVSSKSALLGFVERQQPSSVDVERALAHVRQCTNGFPDAACIDRLRAQVWPERDEGIGSEAMLSLLQEYVTPLTGGTYQERTCGRGRSKRHLGEVCDTLKQGHDVVLGIAEPGHWMLMSATRIEGGERHFLISDPDSGKTAWVKEAALADGTFASQVFQLSRPDERPYVDTFLLASTAA
jgi:hypothetical protein